MDVLLLGDIIVVGIALAVLVAVVVDRFFNP